MIFNYDLLEDSIVNGKHIGNLFKSTASELLNDYKVNDYVSTDNIPDINLADCLVKTPAPYFFDDHQYLTGFKIDDIIPEVSDDFSNDFKVHKRFPFPFVIHFFDTFIVAEVMPYSLETIFLTVAPDSTESDGSDITRGLLSAAAITDLFSIVSMDSSEQLNLYIKIDHLLEYLRTGKGKIKRFGIF